MLGFDLAQTFYLDKDAVQGADQAFLTAVDLYFYRKPVAGKTKSGISGPGASVYLCPVLENGTPDLNLVHHTFGARVEYADIATSTSGTTATTFTFRQPIPVPTARSYGILIKFDGSDSDFQLWYNKSGDNVLGTTTQTQVSSGKVDGFFYKITNGKELTPERDADLSFRLKVAKFSSTSSTFKIKNRPYEILKLNANTSLFRGGEEVYQQRANAAGNVSITTTGVSVVGTGTAFNSTLLQGDKVILTDGTAGNTDVRTVVSVANATYMTVDVEPSFTAASGKYYKTVVGKVFQSDGITDFLVIQDANSNSSLYLTTGTTITGVDSLASANIVSIYDYAINSIVPGFNVKAPSGTSVSTTVNFANADYQFTSSTVASVDLGRRRMLNEYAAVLASSTNEQTAATPVRSFNGTLTLTTSNPYVSPYVRQENLDLFAERYEINNDATNEYAGNGNAKARYISKTIALAEDQKAEDLKVFVRAYKPANTSILVYAKLRNSEDTESFDVKDWTELTVNNNVTIVSNPANIFDRIELAYDVPFMTASTLVDGQFTTTSACTVITGTSGTVNTSIQVGDVVRVSYPASTTTYFTDTVVAANTTTITVANPVSNSSLIGPGYLVNVVDRPNSGYLDIQQQNVLTYYNRALSKFQTFDSFAIKIVLLSEDGVKIPYVDDVRAIAVSA
jgi:hypothetical protein